MENNNVDNLKKSGAEEEASKKTPERLEKEREAFMVALIEEFQETKDASSRSRILLTLELLNKLTPKEIDRTLAKIKKIQDSQDL